jgi:dethiobiotin synthetase
LTRPDRLVVVAGTATEVGKTWVSSHWLATMAPDTAAARKPVQSFSPGDEGGTDAELLAAATGEPPEVVCPRHRWYEVAMAPPMAAAVLGRPAFTVADLVAEIDWPAGAAFGLVEAVGGVRSPLADDGDTVQLVRALSPDDVLLVADAGLGTINAVRLCASALGSVNCIVFLNRFDRDDDLHRRNLEWLSERDGLQVVTAVDAL